MKRPEMILFDFGDTLLREVKFDPLSGTAAVLEACNNPKSVSAEEVQKLAFEMNCDLGRKDRNPIVEVQNIPFQKYLYEFFGIDLLKSHEEIEQIFWDATYKFEPTPGIKEFLGYLKEINMRVGIISNISFSGEFIRRELETQLPGFNFEFIIASSDYVYRKPHKRIFELALRKAGLDAGEVWYAGDRFDRDVAGAVNAGMLPVWYRGVEHYKPQAENGEGCLEVKSWSELKTFVENCG